MTKPISNRFVLVGALKGQTVNLGGHDFIDGVHDFVYVQDGGGLAMPSQDDIKLKAANLERNYQAFPEDSAELAEAETNYGKLVAAAKKGEEPAPVVSTPKAREDKEQDDRSEKVVADRAAKTAGREALLKLDPANDDHWTDAGLPSVEAVREIAGVQTISRADITALAPNLNRDEAIKLNAEKK